MAKVGAQRAAELTGKSKSTIQRAMNSGKLSYELDANERRTIDVSELERVFGLKQNTESASQGVEHELEKAKQLLEMERLKMRIKTLEDQLYTANSQIEDLKEQRDKWQKQADQVLITSQYSQRQAEAMREEIKEREERVRVRRQKAMDEKMKRLKHKAENQNASMGTSEQDDEAFGFNGLWKRVKGEK